jgi:hypothetical protein
VVVEKGSLFDVWIGASSQSSQAGGGGTRRKKRDAEVKWSGVKSG